MVQLLIYLTHAQWRKPRGIRGDGSPKVLTGDRVSYIPPMFNPYDNKETAFLMTFYFHHLAVAAYHSD